ncbi:hypothetical protein IIA28_20265 [candidate division KSB1 bacterium]|nr:hypothetical protein [candidate division KSB1 bacterium]
MSIIPVKVCYLCGQYILPEHEIDEDHAYQKVLWKKKQPKVKGLEYGGTITTHRKCNNEFGGALAKAEVICKKALILLRLLFDEKSYVKRFYEGDPNLGLLALDSRHITGFSNKELEFFKMNNVSDMEYKSWANISYLEKLDKVDPRRIPANIAITVLAKSVAALLVSRNSALPDSHWKIAVYPGFDKEGNADFDNLYGHTKPFDFGVKVWIKDVSKKDYLVIFKYEKFIAFYHFNFSDEIALQQVLPSIFAKENIVHFQSSSLLDLIGYDWYDNYL